jgi:hypothetical protein
MRNKTRIENETKKIKEDQLYLEAYFKGKISKKELRDRGISLGLPINN